MRELVRWLKLKLRCRKQGHQWTKWERTERGSFHSDCTHCGKMRWVFRTWSTER